MIRTWQEAVGYVLQVVALAGLMWTVLAVVVLIGN
jgi:hypothetical protein